MSIALMTKVWQTETETHTEKLVLLALADNANDQGFCWPSLETLARKCCLTEQGVRNKVKLLSEKGWLEVDKRHKNGNSNCYTLTLPDETRTPTPLGFKKAVNPNAVGFRTPTPLAFEPQRGLPSNPNAVDPNHNRTVTGTVREPEDRAASGAQGSREVPVAPGSDQPPKQSNQKPKKPKGPPNPEHAKFVEAFCAAYQARVGAPYRFAGGKDGRAVKELLNCKGTADGLMAVVTRMEEMPDVRDYWACKAGLKNLAAMASRWNEIQAELADPPKVWVPPSQRPKVEPTYARPNYSPVVWTLERGPRAEDFAGAKGDKATLLECVTSGWQRWRERTLREARA